MSVRISIGGTDDTVESTRKSSAPLQECISSSLPSRGQNKDATEIDKSGQRPWREG